ncbi:hypothetical protein J3L16_09410 [Alteromonas sp. 5E99-2]|uniref:hypothetical protein n=1 Tax=Alteromonas sp. 5E99-2 TaxID=2817683 RepID=UPI001A98BC9B|nr:hypothetical protein [Alteromonas sp. 5E99-2]MBO1255899.1 hypothetical protein [Alteromonas sp. 5E99-2]
MSAFSQIWVGFTNIPFVDIAFLPASLVTHSWGLLQVETMAINTRFSNTFGWR